MQLRRTARREWLKRLHKCWGICVLGYRKTYELDMNKSAYAVIVTLQHKISQELTQLSQLPSRHQRRVHCNATGVCLATGIRNGIRTASFRGVLLKKSTPVASCASSQPTSYCHFWLSASTRQLRPSGNPTGHAGMNQGRTIHADSARSQVRRRLKRNEARATGA